MNTPSNKPRIGLVLGSGSARGWAHIGVIRALEAAGIKPDIVCGTSIGALVGAAYAAGQLSYLEAWVSTLGIKDVLSFMDIHMNGGGMLKGERLMSFFRRNMTDSLIEELPMPFAAVATSLNNGAEIWLQTGSVLNAVRASIALPGLFSPVRHHHQLLVDGGLVNPVPVSLARAMGAEILIAVDLNADLLSRHLRQPPETSEPAGLSNEWMRRLQQNLGALLPEPASETPKMPSVVDIVATSLNIMQVRITRSRMAGEPPDVIIAPRLSHLGLLDFHRAKEAIEEGKRAVDPCMSSLQALCGLSAS